MKCKDVGFGTADCAYNITLPYLVGDPANPAAPKFSKTVCIDKCLLPEVLRLWEMGIKTTGCCCGHDRQPPFIGVLPEYIETMKALGYAVLPNSCRPGDEDSFVPKTEMAYGMAHKGFNWWDDEEGVLR